MLEEKQLVNTRGPERNSGYVSKRLRNGSDCPQLLRSADMASTANPNARLVLVAEDETVIVRGITIALAKGGLRAIVAENGAAGLEAFLAEPDAIDLVLADVVMPVMDGITMVRDIRRVRP